MLIFYAGQGAQSNSGARVKGGALEMLVEGDGLLEFGNAQGLSMGQVSGFHGKGVVLIVGNIFTMGGTVVCLLAGWRSIYGCLLKCQIDLYYFSTE